MKTSSPCYVDSLLMSPGATGTRPMSRVDWATSDSYSESQLSGLHLSQYIAVLVFIRSPPLVVEVHFSGVPEPPSRTDFLWTHSLMSVVDFPFSIPLHFPHWYVVLTMLHIL